MGLVAGRCQTVMIHRIARGRGIFWLDSIRFRRRCTVCNLKLLDCVHRPIKINEVNWKTTLRELPLFPSSGFWLAERPWAAHEECAVPILTMVWSGVCNIQSLINTSNVFHVGNPRDHLTLWVFMFVCCFIPRDDINRFAPSLACFFSEARTGK
jgi:hypothetical protein